MEGNLTSVVMGGLGVGNMTAYKRGKGRGRVG